VKARAGFPSTGLRSSQRPNRRCNVQDLQRGVIPFDLEISLRESETVVCSEAILRLQNILHRCTLCFPLGICS
jgi:hypothetical protein